MLGALAGGAALAAMPSVSRGPLFVPSGAGPTLATNPFTLGVASGDPLSDGIVLWTRLVVDPAAPAGGMPAEPVRVQWELAADERFRKKVSKGVVRAQPDDAHAVHVDVRGLDPAHDWFFRFRVGDHESPIGRTRTAPADGATAKQLVFAVASCQQYHRGYFTAHRHLAEEDLDAVLFVGDYMYESGFQSGGVRELEGPEPTDLDAYRARYATYKSDPNLQAAHAACPWVVTWDDHEVDNNYADSVSQDAGVLEADFLTRRAAAYRVWWEHQPVRLDRPTGPDFQIHRTVEFGRLAQVHVLDTRQYRTPQCEDVASDLGPRCEAAFGADATLLGDEQERWLERSLRKSDARWNVLAQQVLMAQSNFVPTTPEGIFALDSWDGYVEARKRLLGTTVNGVENLVTVTGDIHAAWVNDLKADYSDPASPVVGTELVGTSITSLFPVGNDLVYTAMADQPHLKYFEGQRRGYLRCTFEKSELRADHRFVSTTQAPDATIETGASFVVEAGRPGAEPA